MKKVNLWLLVVVLILAICPLNSFGQQNAVKIGPYCVYTNTPSWELFFTPTGGTYCWQCYDPSGFYWEFVIVEVNGQIILNTFGNTGQSGTVQLEANHAYHMGTNPGLMNPPGTTTCSLIRVNVNFYSLPGEVWGINAFMLPAELELQAYPNPFNPSTTISYTLPQSATVTLTVYDINGQQVATLVNGWRGAGNHEVTFDGANLASGTYFYRLQAGDNFAIGKMILVK